MINSTVLLTRKLVLLGRIRDSENWESDSVILPYWLKIFNTQ